MNLLADTSVLVAAMVEAHPAHLRSQAWFERVLAGGDRLYICTHSLAELYAVLTRLPVRPRIGPDVARRLIRDNIEDTGVGVVELDAADYRAVLDSMAAAGLSGGVIYDALAVHAARKIGARRIMTLNESDFARLCPENHPVVTAP